jgi:cytochrome c556
MCKGYVARWSVLALLFALSGPLGADFEEEDVLEYRQRIMASMNSQAMILGQIVSWAVPNDQVIEHLEAMALLAQVSLRSFEQEVHGGESKPEVWSDWEEFARLMREFSQNATQAAANARANGKDDALNTILNVLTCKQCHDKFRE